MNDRSERAAWDSEIDERLRDDAATWGGAPSADGAARLRAALATRERPRPRIRTIVAAAAAIVVSVAIWPWLEPVGEQPGRPAEVAWVTEMIDPLQREFDAVKKDASAVAATIFGPVSKMGRTVGYLRARSDH